MGPIYMAENNWVSLRLFYPYKWNYGPLLTIRFGAYLVIVYEFDGYKTSSTLSINHLA